jgi:hypothetical protein
MAGVLSWVVLDGVLLAGEVLDGVDCAHAIMARANPATAAALKAP